MGGTDRRDTRTGALTRHYAELPLPFATRIVEHLRLPNAAWLPIVGLTAAIASTLGAQDTTVAPGTPPPPANVPRCNGETISELTIDRAEPVMIEKSVGWARPFLRFALSGAPTRESAVAPFLLIKVGEPCTELLLRESERVLRAQPYLADARAIVTPDTSGSVKVHVTTVDDIRPIVGLGMKDGSPSRFKIGSGNLAGYGMAGSVGWRNGYAFRDGWSAAYTNYHVLGRPWLFDGVFERAPLGQIASASLSKPLYSNLQRLAWSAAVARVDRYQRFIRSEDVAPISLDVQRRSWQVNSVYRVSGGNLGFFAGASVAGDKVMPADDGVIITDTGFVADADTVLGSRYVESNRTIAAAILGMRALSFFKAQGFDALEGAQDVANGIQLGALLGRQMQSGPPDGWFVATALYAGAGTPRSFVGFQAGVESGHADGEWNDMIAAGRLAWYSRPSRRRTRIAALEYSGAWNSTVPFQLELGTDRFGVRGYDDSYTAGGRRAVLRIEERLIFPGISKYAGFGGAGFLDVGKMWAGDVPFGDTVNPRIGAGIGLIFAVPRSSRRNLRVDVAAPLISDAGSGWGVNVTITSGRPRFWREPSDLARARSAAQTPVVFGWP